MLQRFVMPAAVLLLLVVTAAATLAGLSANTGEEPMRSGSQQDRRYVVPSDEQTEFIHRVLRALDLPAEQQVPLAGIVVQEQEVVEARDEVTVVVIRVLPGSPAALGGLQEGDAIRAVGGKSAQHALDVVRIVGGVEPGQAVRFRVLRDGVRQDVMVRLATQPSYREPGDDEFERARSLLARTMFLALFDILPEGVGEQRFDQLQDAHVTVLDESGMPVTLRLMAGTVASLSEDGAILLVSPNNGTFEREVTITEATKTARLSLAAAIADPGGVEFVAPALVSGPDMAPGDRVLVVTQGNSGEASAIFAMPPPPDPRTAAR